MAAADIILAWGSGEDGQLGIGSSEDRDWVCSVKALEEERVVSVVAGSRNSLAICEDGKLFTWGWNQRGTLGHAPETKIENIPSQVKALSNVKIVQAAIGGWHCLAVDDQGRAYAWGGNEYGQCGDEPDRKDDNNRALRRDIVIPQRCASKLSVRQGVHSSKCSNTVTDIVVDYTSQFSTDKIFNSKNDMVQWARAVGRTNGIIVVIEKSDSGTSTKKPRIKFGCERGGSYKAPKHKGEGEIRKEKRPNTGTKKCGCPFTLKGQKLDTADDWILIVVCGVHNHPIAKYHEGHPYTGRLSSEETSFLTNMSKNLVRPKDILGSLKSRDPENSTTIKTIYNVRQRIKVAEKAGRSQMQALLAKLEERKYLEFHRTCSNTDNVADLFWAHPVGMDLLRTFPRVLIMDCTYKTNRYKLPLFEVVGITSTDKTFNIAFAFIQNEKEKSYTWALERLHSLMDPHALPQVIITDRELALMNAIEKVFPAASHMLCSWHVQKNIASKCKKMFITKREWDYFNTMWNLIVYAPTEEKYNSSLSNMNAEFNSYPDAIKYVTDNWLNPYKEKFVAAWTDRHMHFGNTTTNRYKAGLEELIILKKLVGADPDDKRHCVKFLSSFKALGTVFGEDEARTDDAGLQIFLLGDSYQWELFCLYQRTYSEPRKWMRGKGRVTIQFGCCYNYAVDKKGNLPGILRDEEVDPIPTFFKTVIKRLVRWHVLPKTRIPNSCIVNIYDEGDCIPPHIDHHDFVRPFCTVSFLTEADIVFGSSLKIGEPGEFFGPVKILLPVGSVIILNGNGADVAKHCVPSVPAKRISITFRKMDDSKLPYRLKPDPDFEGMQPFSYPSSSSPGLQAVVVRQVSNRNPQVAAGGTHSVVLTHDGHVWIWGQPWPPGDIKQISTPVRVQGLDKVRLIAVGAFHNLALSEGVLWAWGNNEYGQLGTGDTQPRSQPIPVQGLSELTLVDIAAGGWHSTAMTVDGEVYAWGRGEHGRLGLGDDKSSKMVPQKVQLLAGEAIVQVSCGGTHSVACTSDGRMFSYGRGDHGRLGCGRKVTTGHPMEVPIKLRPPADLKVAEGHWSAKLIACGGRHTLAIAVWVDESGQIVSN